MHVGIHLRENEEVLLHLYQDVKNHSDYGVTQYVEGVFQMTVRTLEICESLSFKFLEKEKKATIVLINK